METIKRIATQLRALGDELNLKIIGLLMAKRPKSVPVHVVCEELGNVPQRRISKHLAKLRDAGLIASQGRKKGYLPLPDSQRLRAKNGTQSYTDVTQGYDAQNEDTPGNLSAN